MGYKQIFNPLSGTFDSVLNTESPAFTGTPTTPTQSPLDSSDKIASTEYVDDAIIAAGGGNANYLININDNQSAATSLLTLDANTISADVSLTAQRLSTVSQSSLLAIDGTIPNYPAHTTTTAGVRACVVQPDGKIIIGGSFSKIGVTTQRRLCRYNADYTLDTAFNANVDYATVSGEVTKILLQPDGKILVAGTFLNWKGISGNHLLVRLNADGTRDATFCNAIQFYVLDNGIYDISLDSSGNIYAAGTFTSYRDATFGTGISYLVKFDSAGAVDVTFANNAVRTGTTAKFNNSLWAIAVNSSNECFVGGDFTNYTLTGRSRFVKLQASGIIDTAFTDAASLNAGVAAFSSTIRKITLSGTDIFVGGSFTNYKSATYGGGISYLLKLDSLGSPDIVFADSAVRIGVSPSFGGGTSIASIKLVGSDIYVGGQFTKYPFSTGVTTNPNLIVKISTAGVPDATWNNNQISKMPSTIASVVYGIDVDPAGNILAGGIFNAVNYASPSTVYNNGFICHINLYTSTGTQASFIPFTTSKFTNNSSSVTVHDTVVQSDGKRILVGSFYEYGGVANRNLIVRLNTDDSVDTGFCSFTDFKFNNPAQNIRRVIIQPDGKIILAGSFTDYGGTTGQSFLIRLNSDGSTDTSFNAAVLSKFNNSIIDIALSGTSIIAAGNFINFGGTTGKNYLIRLTTLGAEDTAFTAAAVWTTPTTAKFSASVNCIAVQSTGNIFVGGFFSNYGGVVGRTAMVGLTSAGALYTAFNLTAVDGSKFSSIVTVITKLDDDSLIVSGGFTNYAGGGANYMAKISSVGVPNAAFNTAIGTKFSAGSTYLQTKQDLSGKLYVARIGSTYNLITSFDVCILNSDGTFNSAIVFGQLLNGALNIVRIVLNRSKMELCGSFAVLTSGLNSFYKISTFARQAYKTKFQIFKTTTNAYTTSTPETLSDSAVGLGIAVDSSGQITYTTTDLDTETNTILMSVNEFGF